MWKALGDLLMPRTCLVCGRLLGAREDHLCIWCAADLPLTGYWMQPHNPMADKFNETLERDRGDAPMPYANAVALLFYHGENPYRRIPQALKYHDNLEAGRFFSRRLGGFLARAEAFSDVDTVIPVPLHWLRRWRRGFNQAEVIAGELAETLGATLRTDILVRSHPTRTQTRLSAGQRARNVSGVFRVRKSAQGRHLLLVDDTFTTGATLAACYQAIRAVSDPDVRISVATLAVVDAP